MVNITSTPTFGLLTSQHVWFPSSSPYHFARQWLHCERLSATTSCHLLQNHIWWQQLPRCSMTGWMETGTVPKSWVNNVSPKPLGSWFSLLNPLASQPHPQSHWWPWASVGGLADWNAFSPIIPSNPVKQAGQAYFHLYSSVTRLQGWFPARRKPRSPDCPHLPHIRCLLAQVALVLFYFCWFLAIQCLLSSSNT